MVPPKGAPNVLLIMTDDQGYGVSSTFGGVIPTPAMDRLAKAGLRYTQFHSTALCSPTRAALITGRNHHSVGTGVIGEMSTGYPGYDSVIPKDKATIGTILRDNGYATSWFGKNHNTPTYQYSLAGPFDQWPSGMGFEYFYGFMGGETNQWTPYLFRDHTQIYPWVGKPGYNLTTDMADEAISYMKGLNAAAPEKPFFLYYVPGGTHAPHHPTPEWIKKISEMHLFDKGWNELREQIFANQKKLGVIPANTQLTPWPDSLPKWDTLNADEKKVFARQAEIFAAYVAYTDHEIGRVIQAVEDLGKLDNTLIIYISGDNGTSAEGSTIGTPFDLAAIQAINIPVEAQLKFYDVLGSDMTTPHMSVAWSWAFDTPFKWTKQVASFFGGTRQGMVMSWPGHIKDVGRHPHAVPPHHRHRADDPRSHRHPGAGDGEWHRAETDRRREHGLHVGQGERESEVQARHAILRDVRQPRDLPRWLDGRHAASATPMAHGHGQNARRAQRLQMGALQHCRGFLAEQRSRGKESREAEGAAGTLHGGGERNIRCSRWIIPSSSACSPRDRARPPAGPSSPTRVKCPACRTAVCPTRSPSPTPSPPRWKFPQGGAEGMLNTLGGRFGGYGLYLLKGKPVFTYNLLGAGKIPLGRQGGARAGKHTIMFDFKYDGPGMAKGGTGVLSVDGKEVDSKKIPHTIPALMTIDESFDVGVDTRTGVDDKDYQPPFRFTGKLDKLTIKLGPPQMTAEEQKAAAEAVAKASD